MHSPTCTKTLAALDFSVVKLDQPLWRLLPFAGITSPSIPARMAGHGIARDALDFPSARRESFLSAR
jgi:hypothetical protein